MKKPFWIPLITAFGTMIILYVIGSIMNYPPLAFKLSLSYSEISLFPIAIGVIVGFITEWLLKLSHRR